MRIIRDTRETKGYNFDFYNVEVLDRKLKCGDYQAVGLETVIIERKANTGEIYLNLGTLKEQERVYREFELLNSYPEPILLLEFPESHFYDFPRNSTIPESRWHKLRIEDWLLRDKFRTLLNTFPRVKPVFCDTKEDAEKFVYQLFKDRLDGRKKKFNF